MKPKFGSSLGKSIVNIPFLTKVLALSFDHITKKSHSLEKIASGKHYSKSNANVLYKMVAKAVFFGGAIELANLLAKNKIYVKLNKAKLDELDLLNKALKATHSKKQQDLWDEIERSVTSRDSILSKLSNRTLQGADGSRKEIDPGSTVGLINALTKGDVEAKLKSKEKWEAMKISQYEASLNRNQTLIYKNIFETEFDLMSSSKKLTAVLQYAIPQLASAVLERTNLTDLTAWENLLGDGKYVMDASLATHRFGEREEAGKALV